MSELPKNYDPKSVEEKWYAQWLEEKAFAVDARPSDAIALALRTNAPIFDSARRLAFSLIQASCQ